MSKDQKPVWLSMGIIVLASLLNFIVIKITYTDNQNFLWLLTVSMSLLIISIYSAWQTNRMLRRHFMENMQSPASQSQFELLSHSIYPTKIAPTDLKVLIGNDQCSQPYNACIFNIESMKNIKTERPFSHTIKEQKLEYSKYSVDEGLNTYHLAAGGLVWQIGPDYIGCRTENGNFSSKAFKIKARRPEVKMIELKLSSAIKPICPVDSSLNIAKPIYEKIDNSIFPGSAYTTFREAEGMIYFVSCLRELSGGKPIGIRLCINDKKEFYQICYAIRKTQIIPDFIVVEGSFENIGVVHTDQAFHIGIPLYEALLFVSQTLQVYALETKIKIIASGKIISSLDIVRVLALGAHAVCTEMPGNTIHERNTFFIYKGQNVNDFHKNVMRDTVQVMEVSGFRNLSDITLSKFFRRLEILHPKAFADLSGSSLYPGYEKIIDDSDIEPFQMRDEMIKKRATF